MRDTNRMRTEFINKLRREHRWMRRLMPVIGILFASALFYFDLNMVNQIGLGLLMAACLLCTRASIRMSHDDDAVVIMEASKKHMPELGLICLGCALFLDVSAAGVASLMILFAGYEETVRRVEKAQLFAENSL